MRNIEINNNLANWVGDLERPNWWRGKQKFRIVPYIADDGAPDFSVEIQWRELWTHNLSWHTIKETGESFGWTKEKIEDIESFIVTHAMYDIMLQISGREPETK